MPRPPARRLLTCALLTAGFAIYANPAQAAPTLDLETLTGLQAEKMMEDGDLTSVELTRAYIARIATLNKRGPGLNAVTQYNKDALKDAAAADKRRADGNLLGPADGLPILLKDIIDAKGQYTSAGNWSLRNSFPAEDSGVAKKLRENGVVILGKTGLSEFANSFGNQPSGFSNLTGQVMNAVDSDQNPSGSSSGTGSAAAAGLSALTIGTETSGSIISPSQAEGIVGLRPTVGLVPGYGIAPILASQDTAGPMDRTVSNAALTLQSIAGSDTQADDEYKTVFGPNYLATGVIPTPPATVPNYLSALDLNFVQGKKIGYNGTCTATGGVPSANNTLVYPACTVPVAGTPLKIAYDALVAAGATLVLRPQVTTPSTTAIPVPTNYEAHKTIDAYYAHLGPLAPIHNMVEEVADNDSNPREALKFGNATHRAESLVDISAGGANETQFRTNLPQRKAIFHKTIDDMLTYPNSDTTQAPDPVIAILGTVANGPAAGYPQITIPMGYSTTTRRALSISLNGGAYSERNLLGAGYVLEQATKLHQPVSALNPSMYRCAKTVPAAPFASRGGCNPDYKTALSDVGSSPTILGFSLETESAKGLQDRMTAGTLSAETLTKAYLSRIALVNAEGPALQAVRDLNTNAVNEAKLLDQERATSGSRGPLMGIPVLLDDSIDAHGLATTAGSIALQGSKPAQDAKLVAKLKAAGAIILGKTNVTELNGLFDANLPEGYSSLGGQVQLASDTDKTTAGSSAGAATSTATGLAAMTVGRETSTDTAQMIAPAGVAGVVALKPTVGRVSRTGVMPVAKSQDSVGPITRTVYDAATQLQVIAGTDADDTATSGAPAVPNYTSGLTAGALNGKRIAVISSTTAPYPTVVTALTTAGATTVVKTIGTPSPNPASIVPTEFKRDLNTFLASGRTGGATSLQGIIDYNTANPVEGLKYQQGELIAAQATTPDATYTSDLTTGKTANQAVIDGILNNGTPADPSDDFDAIVVPSGNAVVNVADRAGYPLLTVPAGFGTAGAGSNPIGVTFVGTAFSEDKLLADGYAYEQATNVRLAPSFTNPSMFRCVPGSTYFSPYKCHPGDLQGDNTVAASEFPVQTGVGGTVNPTLSLSLGTASASLGTFVPGEAADYTGSLAATVTSTGGASTLSVEDVGAAPKGTLLNGAFALASPLQAKATNAANPSTAFAPLGVSPLALLGYAGPVSKDPVTLSFKQPILATEPLRTGTYAKTLLVTLATSAP